MSFENYEIEEFKANDFYAWMGTRTITPACISFEDYMFGGLWTITKDSEDGDDIYVLSRKTGKEFVRVTDDYSISAVLLIAELTLWGDSLNSAPDLRRIPLSYIMKTPERLRLGDAALQFLLAMVPQKLAQDGIEL